MPPTVLLNALHSVRRRARVLSVLFGVGVAVSIGCAIAAGVLLLALLDYALHLPLIPRLLVELAAVIGLAVALARWVVRPLLARLPLGDVAGRLERVFPQFDDRLRSTVDFAGGQVPGSEMMKDRVVHEATRLAQALDLNRALMVKPVGYAIGLAVLGLVLIGGILASLNPAYLRIGLPRFLTPWNAPVWPKRYKIDVLGEVPTRIPVGQRIDLRMVLKQGDKPSARAIVYYQYDNGPVQQEYMSRGDDGVFTASLDARMDAHKENGSLKVWMEAGDDSRRLEPITVVRRLGISHVEAVVTPPAYSKLPATTTDLSNGPAVLTVGADVELRVSFNKDLSKVADVVLEPAAADMKAPKVSWQPRPRPSQAIGTWNARHGLRFRIRATDIDGFQNSALEEYELIVRPDQSPGVQIENPRRNEERTAVSTVPLQAIAEDDYGVQSVRLVVERLGDKKQWDLPLVDNGAPTGAASWSRIDGGADKQRFRINYPWDLSQLAAAELKSGDVLEYHLLVRDNFSLDGATHPPVPSGKLRITIVSESQLVEKQMAALRNIAHQVNELRNRQNTTKQETAQLQKDTEAKPELDRADKAAAERLSSQQQTAASQAKQIASKLETMRQELEENKVNHAELKDITSDVKDQLNQAAENPMKKAAANINAAKDAKAPPKGQQPPGTQPAGAEQRNQQLQQAQSNQQQASDQLQKALDKMGNIGSLQIAMDKIKSDLNRQEELNKELAKVGEKTLGKKPEDLKPDEKAKLEQLAKDQQALAERTAKDLADIEKMAEQMKQSDPASSQAMQKAAQTGKSQNVPGNQSKAAQAAQQNQQAQAQAAQQQAELGLRMILNELREAERRKLEELARQLEELQKQLEGLIRRQAGHNLDNLALQGPQRIAKVDAKIYEDLLSKAVRAKDKPLPVPDLPALSTGQEQTERNTRGVGRAAEATPNGAEAAALLTRAANHMERAAVNLRDNKLPDAYDPPQVQALAALDEAKKKVDEQKNAVDQKRNEQQKEAIREVYVKIKAEQEKINAETIAVDQSPRLPDGAFKREVIIDRLNPLPGKQGTLSDRVKKLEEDLSAVGGVVYVWANKDIAKSMDQVKDDLGKQEVGKATQAEENRIVEQLDAMIRNLAIKPEQSPFSQRGGGGGSSGSGKPPPPRLPTEAELRLLKDLQVAVNKSTKIIDGLVNKDKGKLLALGGRQGSLREVLDQLLQKSSRGQLKLGPEPQDTAKLPEEAGKEAIEDQELEANLLEGEPNADKMVKDVHLIGDRMARSKKRLGADHDPGKVTQTIQERIVNNLDDLIQMARAQDAQAQPSQGQGQGQPKPGQPKPGQGQMGQQQAQGQQPGQQSQPNNSRNAAQNSTISGGGSHNADLSQDIKEKMAEWGGVTQRERDAVIEGGSETVVEKYKKLVDDYYRELAKKATERR